ncbi:hypothetical protein NA78x_005747 [Anatilimnocola sp. NA78]|uniref:hypothetical protein n=1 Tax=Anatilimnocola sp. NA78 TaxID=3415683 RepID=UPI003CE59CA7
MPIDHDEEYGPTPEEFEADVLAVRQALDDMAAGDTGIPFEEFDKKLRAKYNLPPRPEQPK